MLQLWNSWRARRAAVSTILPLVERTRFVNGHIAEDRWLDAYMVGFLTMLISLVARRYIHSIDSETLGNVQAEAWQEITGLPGELVGEEACLLSADGHQDFMRGCENAGRLDTALTARGGFRWFNSGSPDPEHSLLSGEGRPMLEDTDIHALWQEFFERPLLNAVHTADGNDGWSV